MSLKDLKLKLTYTSPNDDISNELIIPLLCKSSLYKRSVGYFSSSVYKEIYEGIFSIASRGGRIQIITSPELKHDDIEAICKGYDERAVINNALKRSWEHIRKNTELDELALLANLISDNILDIKIAYSKNEHGIGLYHEKVSIFEDSEGNNVIINGSLNETFSAYRMNYETVDVYTSWEDYSRIHKRLSTFNQSWLSENPYAIVFDFPSEIMKEIKSYKKQDLDYLTLYEAIITNNKKKKNHPIVPNYVSFHDYQEEAIENFKKSGFRGIFEMATGTGKTYTALGAIVECFNSCGRLAVIIVCPYQHLVTQWGEEVSKYNINPILSFSNSPQRKHREIIIDLIRKYNRRFINFLCVITTNATFSSSFFQEAIMSIKLESMLVIDEAHNIGTKRQLNSLYNGFDFRLALSATLDRHRDEEGTLLIRDYFGDACIVFTLKEALDRDYLTCYKYFPILVYLNDVEQIEYTNLSYSISKEMHDDGKGKRKLSEKGKRLAIKRARVVAGASNKMGALREAIHKFRFESQNLVYCGATNVINESIERCENSEERQITAVTKMLGLELDMKVAKYTAEESSYERQLISRSFINGDIQALVAIRCLDEGVDIPSIKRAFILASSTNPKEYIQRRGRVLRKSKDKVFAEIYDFVTLVRPIDEKRTLSFDEEKYDDSLIRKELIRVIDFASLAINPEDSDDIISILSNEIKDFLDEEELDD